MKSIHHLETDKKNNVRWKDLQSSMDKKSLMPSPSQQLSSLLPDKWTQSWWNLHDESQMPDDDGEEPDNTLLPFAKVTAADHLRAFLGDNKRLRLIQKARILQQWTNRP